MKGKGVHLEGEARICLKGRGGGAHGEGEGEEGNYISLVNWREAVDSSKLHPENKSNMVPKIK